MKKVLITIISITIITFILLFNAKVFKIEKPLYKDITIKKLQQIMENDDAIVYFYQKNCIPCKSVLPVINEVIKNENIGIYAIDLNTVTNVEFLKKDLAIAGSPTILFISKGKIQDRLEGTFNSKQLLKKIHQFYK